MTGPIVPSLEGRTFRTTGTAEQGEATAETLFEYHEDNGLVWARYSGGSVRLGFIVGTRTGDELDIRYSQLNTAGETASGRCHTTMTTLPDGRVSLSEDWAWETKPGSGTNFTEEAPR